jgi:hypothetical protein
LPLKVHSYLSCHYKKISDRLHDSNPVTPGRDDNQPCFNCNSTSPELDLNCKTTDSVWTATLQKLSTESNAMEIGFHHRDNGILNMIPPEDGLQ